MQHENAWTGTIAPARIRQLAPDLARGHARWTALAIALVTGLGMVTASGPAAADQTGGHGRIVVQSTADGLTLSRDVTHAGRVTITMESLMPDDESGHAAAGGAIMFRLVHPATLATLRADFQDELSADPAIAARGTRNLTLHARFYGLADATRGRPVSVTQTLTAGTYYVIDNLELAEGTSHLVPFTVLGRSIDHTGQESGRKPTVTMTSGDRYAVPQPLPAKGTIWVRNLSDTPHFMQMWPVVPGTTDTAVQAWLDDGAQVDPGFFLDGPTTALNLLSPGQNAQLTYDMPAGSYLLLCEIRDAETGVPHVFMGMHRVISLT